MGRASRVGLNDVLVGGLVLALLTAAVVGATRHAREFAQRNKCASNLHQIGLAILLYQQDSGGVYPRTVMGTSDRPRPTWGTPYDGNADLGPRADADPFAPGKAQPADNDVSAAFFLLLRNEQISNDVFVCPDSKADKWDNGGGSNTAQNWTNWSSAMMGQHLSYSYQNPYPTAAAVETGGYTTKNPDATFAVAADMNPGGAAVLTVKPESGESETRAANSLNHEQEGQNVLYGDGHAEWVSSPFAGTKHDNIYTAAGPELTEPGRGVAGVAKASVSGTDSVLLPTAHDVGYGPPMPEPERNKLAAAIVGTYAATVDGKAATLTVGAKTIRCKTGPVTIEFNYTVSGDNGLGLTLDLTAPDTKERATVLLAGDDLSFAGGGRYNLDLGWRRATPAK